MSSKINEHSEFTRKEMFLIKSILFPDIADMRYLFESDTPPESDTNVEKEG